MMRKTIFMLLLASGLNAMAQNVQLHADFGHALYHELDGRPNVTTTVEMFKPDKWGSTYLFTDIDYYGDGAAGVYWEISRELTFLKDKHWAVHVEYDGGATSIKHTAVASRFQHAFLGGLAWNTASKDFTKTFSLQALYKYYFKGMGAGPFNGFQMTSVWSDTFAGGFCTFSGFLDVWYNKEVRGKLTTLSEPQFWVNLQAIKGMEDVHLSLGTEVEISNQFVFDNAGRRNQFYVIPTLAAKWTF